MNKTPKARVDVTESAPRFKISHLAYLAIALIVLASLFVFQNSKSSESCAIVAPDSGNTRQKCIALETVDSDEERTQGLSGRESMTDVEGMLFIFDESGQQCFWMKDMNFSLDIIWLNDDKEIIKIENRVRPETYPKSFCASPTKYVVELNEGVAEKVGLRVGQKINL